MRNNTEKSRRGIKVERMGAGRYGLNTDRRGPVVIVNRVKRPELTPEAVLVAAIHTGLQWREERHLEHKSVERQGVRRGNPQTLPLGSSLPPPILNTHTLTIPELRSGSTAAQAEHEIFNPS
ncbi:hypothetical protein NDU88_003108 [Pleurodeles waltl]|uniref:Uncharacterized protein n=1 Tax=Pleurodeles waltl TaxID=8319 RepID=A0AAV7UDD7_PLEWA|nr:hypothetical protein NDU88_003108 [Pleurodeles waltl]